MTRDRLVARYAALHESRTGDGRAGDHGPVGRVLAGAVLYEMLTGEPPHTGSSAQPIIMKIIDRAATGR